MFFSRLRSSAPQFKDDPEKTRYALLLHLASIVLFFVPVLLIILNMIFGNPAERSINVILAGIAVIQIPVQYLVRNGRVRLAIWCLLLLSWVAMTWIASKVAGVSDVAVVVIF